MAHLLTLSDVPSLGLLVSERTKHLLNNLVIEDIHDPQRYAVSYDQESYEPLRPGDLQWPLFLSVAERASIELVDLMPTLDEWLEQLDKRAMPIAGKIGGDGGIAGAADPWDLSVGPVPEGEIWLVTHIVSTHLAGTWSSLHHYQYSDEHETLVSLGHWLGGGAAVDWYGTNGAWYLSPGDSIVAQWTGTSEDLEAILETGWAVIAEPL